MSVSTFIALRYARPSAKQRFLSFVSLIALASIALGCAALIIALAVLGGFERELRENAVKFTSHIQIVGYGKKPVPNYDRVLATLPTSEPEIRAMSPFIQHESIIRSSAFVDGMTLKGIFSDGDVTGVRSAIKKGKFGFSSPKAYEIIIGAKAARKFNVDIGSKLTIFAISGTPSAENPPNIEQVTVTGIFESGMAEYDDLYAYIPFGIAAELFSVPYNAASGFDILLHDVQKASEVSNRIEEKLGYPYYPRTVFEMYASMFAWIELQKQPIPIVLALISIVAVFNVVATLLMLVVEKLHSIGILRALGLRQRHIMQIFLVQGLSIGFVGTAVGCLLGFSACWIQATYKVISLKSEIYFLSSAPIEFSVWHYLIVGGVSMFFCFLATLIPALIAARIQPIRAIRFR